MVAALDAALSCARCASEVSDGPAASCAACGERLAPPTNPSAYRERLPGVSPAAARRRWAATGVDLVAVVLVAALVFWAAVRFGGPLPPVLAALAALAVAVAGQVVGLTRHGRTLGRWLLGLRTVDDLTGNPLRVSRVARRPFAPGRQWRAVTADLRTGRDPLPWAPKRPSRSAGPSPSSRPPEPEVGERGVRTASDFAESVAVVLDGGERHEVDGSMLIGRVPENGPGEEHPLLAWPDISRRLSKTHVLIEWSGTVLWVTDRHSVTGTVLVAPGGERQILSSGARGAAGVGWTIELGGRPLTVRPGATGG